MSKLCYGCMKMKNNSPVCEHCGYNENVPNYPHQLPIGTVLKDQYVVGKVLGQGGFGITYIGWDQYLETPVAIKEFYPNAYVSRECSVTQNVTCIADTVKDTFQHNRSRFLREARVLAKLSNVPGIVRVHNLFSENSTAYIIMEYVEGIDLKRYLRMRGQTLTVEEMLHVMQPVMKALMQIHKVELVHRDISPDNIMIQPDGTAKLLDFGAAREVVDADQGKEMPQSTEAILKHGFAPIEQYRRRGSLGPWTDVYSLCATIYYCLAGKVPADAPERVMGDDNVNWAQIPGLTDQQRAALEQGMAMLPEKRIASVQELYQALYSRTATEYSTSRSQVRSEAQPKPEPKPEPQPEPKPEPEPVVKDYPVGTLALEEEPEIPETPKEEPKVKPAKEPEVAKEQESVKVEQPKTEPVKAEKQEEKPVSKKSPLDSLKSWYVLNILPKLHTPSKLTKKNMLIGTVAVCAVVCCIFLTGGNRRLYKKAENFMEQRNYTAALEIYEQLSEKDYKDSADMLKAAKYGLAADHLSNKNYDEAKTIFTELSKSNYKDSAKKAKECIYQEGQNAYRKALYTKAKEYFNSISDYKDVQTYLQLMYIRDNIKNYEGYNGTHSCTKKITDYIAAVSSKLPFEDAADVLLSSTWIAVETLAGSWHTANYSHNFFFNKSEDYTVSSTLPQEYLANAPHYYIDKGIYYLSSSIKDVKQYKFTLTGPNSMNVYCYKDGKTYEMIRDPK